MQLSFRGGGVGSREEEREEREEGIARRRNCSQCRVAEKLWISDGAVKAARGKPSTRSRVGADY